MIGGRGYETILLLHVSGNFNCITVLHRGVDNMSQATWHNIRKAIKPYGKQFDREERKKIRIPLYVRFLSLFSKGFKRRYLKEWEKEHRRKLKRAMKISSHIIRGKM